MQRYFVRLLLLAITLASFGVACSPESTPVAPTALVLPTSTALPSAPTLPSSPTRALTPTSGPSPTQTAPPTPGPRENLLAAFDVALAKIKTFRVKVILNPTRQDDPERIIEVIMPDRFRQIQESDIRQIGNKVYIVEPYLGSRTMPGLLPFFERVHLPWYRSQFAQAAQVTFLGRSVIDGAQLVGYQTTVKYQSLNASDLATFGKVTDQATKVWFSAANGFPVRIEVGQPIIYINFYYDINGKIDEIGPP